MKRYAAGLHTSWPGRIAFVHIPKTGGNSIIHAFETALGPMRCASFASSITDESFRTRMFVAGHVQLSQITPRAFAFTFLRDPIRQIASHLRWIDHYNMAEFAEEAEGFAESIRAAIARVRQTDFADARSLAAFFDWLPPESHLRIRNVQCEVLAAESDRICYTDQDEMAAAALHSLDQLGYVGFAEHLERDLRQLFALLGIRRRPVVTRLNPAVSTRLIDVSDAAIRQVLAREVGADIVLYNQTRSRRRPVVGRIFGRMARTFQTGDNPPAPCPPDLGRSPDAATAG